MQQAVNSPTIGSHGVFTSDDGIRLLGDATVKVGVPHQLVNAIGVATDVVRGDKESRAPVGDDLGNAGGRRGEHGHLACLGLDDGQRQPFVCGGEQQKVGGAQKIGTVGAEAEEAHAIGDAQFSDQRPQVPPILLPAAASSPAMPLVLLLRPMPPSRSISNKRTPCSPVVSRARKRTG